MDLDDQLTACDPAAELNTAVHASVIALIAEAEAATSAKPRRRRLLIVGGVAGAVLIGGGVAQAAGISVIASDNSRPHPSCSTVVLPLTGLRNYNLSMTRQANGLIAVKSLIAAHDRALRIKDVRSPSKEMLDLVQRLNAAQRLLYAAKLAHAGTTCQIK